jgi:hypothetical protein
MPYSYWLFLAFILVESILPQNPKHNLSSQHLLVRADYLVHFSIFLLVYIGFIILQKIKRPPFLTGIYLKLFLSSALIAIVSEVLQLPSKTRTFNWYDMLANFTGILAGLLLLRCILRKSPKPLSS